jgi:hypothetical protein
MLSMEDTKATSIEMGKHKLQGEKQRDRRWPYDARHGVTTHKEREEERQRGFGWQLEWGRPKGCTIDPVHMVGSCTNNA